MKFCIIFIVDYMTLIDKFGILNQSSQNDKIRIDSIIDNYLENLIINNDYVLSPNIVHKNIWEIVNLRIQDNLDEVESKLNLLPEIPQNFMRNIFDSKINDEIDEVISSAINKEKTFIQEMSPKYWGDKINSKVFIMHGSNDSMVPFTESLALNKCIKNSSLFISYMYEHKEISTDKGIIFKIKEFYKMFKFFKKYFKYNEC